MLLLLPIITRLCSSVVHTLCFDYFGWWWGTGLVVCMFVKLVFSRTLLPFKILIIGACSALRFGVREKVAPPPEGEKMEETRE